MKTRLKIDVQKKGRLSEKTLNLLSESGIKLSSKISKLKEQVGNFPVEILYLRDDDIPKYVERGVADIGILGENEVLEQNKDINIIKKLGFASCKLCLAIPKDKEYNGLNFFEGKRVATSYPNILKDFFSKQKLTRIIHQTIKYS